MKSSGEQQIYARASIETATPAAAKYEFWLKLDLREAVAIAGMLQLATRDAGNGRPSARISRGVLNSIIESLEAAGLPAMAELVRAGDNR